MCCMYCCDISTAVKTVWKASKCVVSVQHWSWYSTGWAVACSSVLWFECLAILWRATYSVSVHCQTMIFAMCNMCSANKHSNLACTDSLNYEVLRETAWNIICLSIITGIWLISAERRSQHVPASVRVWVATLWRNGKTAKWVFLCCMSCAKCIFVIRLVYLSYSID